jgi:hypothetical protein
VGIARLLAQKVIVGFLVQNVVSRPRFGFYSPARTGLAGQGPAKRDGLRQ